MGQSLKILENTVNKLLIITGGSKGIGHATTQHFMKQGYDVVNVSRSASSLEGVTQIVADLSDSDWPKQCGEQLQNLAKDRDQIALVHCAADLRKDSVREIEAESLQQVLQINVVAPTQLNRILLPHMKPGSSIIYVGSTLSEKAVPNSFSYVTSKHATAGLMKATSQDLIGSKIHTACVCPGFTDTEMLRAHVGGSEEILASIASGNSFGRLIDGNEIAETIYFCAQSPVINGSVIHANLGQIES